MIFRAGAENLARIVYEISNSRINYFLPQGVHQCHVSVPEKKTAKGLMGLTSVNGEK